MRTKNYPDLNKLNECINSKGLKRRWIAKTSGLEYQTFCSIAASRCAPTVWEALQIADAIQEPVDKIFLKRNFSESVIGA
jgi:DNA-binding XRE family transcriptional regulator